MLLAPPFYFRPVPDEAVLAWYGAVFQGRRAGPARHHPLSHPGHDRGAADPRGDRRARQGFPRAPCAGVKDSAADADATFALIEAFPELDILVGDETYLGRACAAGGAGSICGLANMVPEAVIALAENGRDDPRVVELVQEISKHSVIPMVKALVAHLRQDPAWAVARPPLPTIDEAAAAPVAALLAPFEKTAGAIA